MSKKEFYESNLHNFMDNGWLCLEDTYVQDGKYGWRPYTEDKCAWQCLPCIHNALQYHATKDPKYYNAALVYLDALEALLAKTDNIFIRDNSDVNVANYVGDPVKYSRSEISKDQTIGMVNGLFFLYYYMDNSFLRTKVTRIAERIDLQLYKYFWCWYNEKKHKLYDSAWYVMVHYYGINSALCYILGHKKLTHPLQPIFQWIGSGCETANVQDWWDIVNKKMWYQNINMLMGYDWYKKLRANQQIVFEFGLNLIFMEYAIAGTISKFEAQKIIAKLEHPCITRMNHLNLSALYVYLCNKWDIKGTLYLFNKNMVDQVDAVLHPDDVMPNNFRIGSYWDSQARFMNHLFYQNDGALNAPKPEPAHQDDLIRASTGNHIEINIGMFYLVRSSLLYFQK